MTSKEYDHLVEHARYIARDSGIDQIFKDYDINIVLGPAESAMTQFASAAGACPFNSMEKRLKKLTLGQDTQSRLYHSAISTSMDVHMGLLQ